MIATARCEIRFVPVALMREGVDISIETNLFEFGHSGKA